MKFSPIFTIRGEYNASADMDASDIIGSITNCIATNVGKLTPQLIRTDSRGMMIRDDYLAKLLSLRWSPELSVYDALYKMAVPAVLPVAFSLYFDIFDGILQAVVFVFLTTLFLAESLED